MPSSVQANTTVHVTKQTTAAESDWAGKRQTEPSQTGARLALAKATRQIGPRTYQTIGMMDYDCSSLVAI